MLTLIDCRPNDVFLSGIILILVSSFHQEYINMVRDFERSKSPGTNDGVLSKLRQRLKEKEKALEVRIHSV